MKANNNYELELAAQGFRFVLGIDEVGTGSLVGDALVAGVIFPATLNYQELLPGLNDSKQKSQQQRIELYHKIKQHAISYGTEKILQQEIEDINIYWAKFNAFKRLVQKFNPIPDYILIDGNHKIRDIETPQIALVKGDSKSISIAAASIIAKVDRDSYIVELGKEYPEYNWASNKAYATKEHKEAIEKYGKTKYHRKNFLTKY